MRSVVSRQGIWLLIAFLLIGSIFWSILYETLLPLVRAEQWNELIANLLGIPLILAGFGAFLWGSWRFLTSTMDVMSAPDEAGEAPADGAEKPWLRKTNAAQRRKLFAAWTRPVIWIAGGFILMLLGGMVINI